MKYGVEEFGVDLIAKLKANLNTKIAELNTLYGAPTTPPTLRSVDDNAYFFQTLDDRVANYDPFVYVESGNPSLDDVSRMGIVETYNFMVLLCFANDGADHESGKKLARYHRAVKEVLVDNTFKIGRQPFKVSSFEQAGYAQINSSQVVRATGLTIEVTFGN